MNGGEGEIRTPDSLSTMPDFESGAFNRALPPLRYVFNNLQLLFAGLIGWCRFWYRLRCHRSIDSRRGVRWCKVSVSVRHLCRSMTQEFSHGAKIDTGHDKSTGEGMPVAMPRVVRETGPRYSIFEPSACALYSLSSASGEHGHGLGL